MGTNKNKLCHLKNRENKNTEKDLVFVSMHNYYLHMIFEQNG